MTKNGIPATNVKFTVVSGAVDNSNYVTNKVVNVSSAELAYAGNDNEVAAVVANELGHIITGNASKGKVINLLQAATNTNITTNDTTTAIVSNYQYSKEEKEADVVAVNLMANAGYNPLAIIVVLTKQTGTYWEAIQGKPANADRAMNVYDFLTYNYAAKVKAGYNCAEYRTFLTYANPVVKKRTSNKKKLAKFNAEQEKAKKQRQIDLAKYKATGGLNSWGVTYDLWMNKE